MVANRVRLVCVDCRHKRTGSPADASRRGCDRCGGQLRVVTYKRAQARRR